MKKLLFLLFFISPSSFGQNYQLLPDTCTHCSWIYTYGGTQFYVGTYSLYPELDTLYQGNVYMKIPITNTDLAGVRQVGNKVYGFISTDTTQEYLIQDWDASVNDTIFNLYDKNGMYDAVFLEEDSVILNDGSYHHWRKLKGINGAVQNQDWILVWDERGLCSSIGWGGLLYNNFVQILGSYYDFPTPHTPDTKYNLNSIVSGCSTAGVFNSNDLLENHIIPIVVFPNPTKNFIQIVNFTNAKSGKIIDLRGNTILKFQETPPELDLSKFSNGTYILQIETESGQSRQVKIVKTD
jgi:hypothetical protein